MKRLILAGLLLASFGASAGVDAVYHCGIGEAGNKLQISNGTDKHGEFMAWYSDVYYHSGNSADGASEFTQKETGNKLFVKYVNEGLTLITSISANPKSEMNFMCQAVESKQ